MLNHNYLPGVHWCDKIHRWFVDEKQQAPRSIPHEIPPAEKFIELWKLQIKNCPSDAETVEQRRNHQRKAEGEFKPPRRMQLITTSAGLLKAQLEIIEQAEHVLATTGSRARDPEYFAAIERRLKNSPMLKYQRVLCAKPPNSDLVAHLRRVMEFRNLTDFRKQGYLFEVGFVSIDREPERFLTANETQVLLPLPSIIALNEFNTALLISDPDYAQKYIQMAAWYFDRGDPFRSNQELDRQFKNWERATKVKTNDKNRRQ